MRITVMAMALAFLPAACRPAGKLDSDSVQPAQVTAVPTPAVVLPDGSLVLVEVVADDELRAQGLMYRESLAHGRGMLFLFAVSDVHRFWMKNTMIPLDILWIDEQRKVVHVERNVPPCTGDPCPNYVPTTRSKYVLELPAGDAERYGIDTGAQLEFRNLEGIRVQ